MVHPEPQPRYRFTATWRVAAAPEAAFAVLEAIPAYPDWWPDVRSVPRWDEDHARVVIRAVVPYTLRLELVRARTDRASGVLEVRIGGDLDGWARWSIAATPTGAELRFAQATDLRAPALRRWETVAAPLFRANHAAMMWRGERGLRAALAGYRVATEPRPDTDT